MRFLRTLILAIVGLFLVSAVLVVSAVGAVMVLVGGVVFAFLAGRVPPPKHDRRAGPTVIEGEYTVLREETLEGGKRGE